MRRLRIAGTVYRWQELGPAFLEAASEWWHPGLAWGADGTLICFDQAKGRLVTISGEGAEIAAVPLPLSVVHGITPEHDPGGGFWVTDPGLHARVVSGSVERARLEGRAILVDQDGRVRLELDAPRPPTSAPPMDARWRPTSVALIGDRIWVADGYGYGIVHRFARDGRYLGGLDGIGTGLAFRTPHAIHVDHRGDEPRVLVADRGNARIVSYDPDGALVGVFGERLLTSPSGMAVHGHLLLVAELRGSLAVLDEGNHPIERVASSKRSHEEPGWPNDEKGGVTRRPKFGGARFNSPHAVVAADDRIVVAEWVLGGRMVELVPGGT